ncbi:MAG: DUF6027 family protein [Actinomycetota bacterium]
MDPESFDPGGRFRELVAASLAADPMPTLRVLAGRLGLPVEQVVHFALHRWASAGSEALLSGPPELLVALRDAADAGDLPRVRGIVAALLAGWDAPG